MLVLLYMLSEFYGSESRMVSASITRGEPLAVNDRYLMFPRMPGVMGDLIYAGLFDCVAGLVSRRVDFVVANHAALACEQCATYPGYLPTCAVAAPRKSLRSGS